MSLIEHGLPLLFVAALWFGSTALVLWLDSLRPSTFGTSLLASGGLAIAGVLAIAATLNDDGIAAAYLAFAAALAVWGWHEVSFLTGIVTGPNRAALPAGTRGWARFRAAAATLIHHEIALALTAVLLAALAWGGSNRVGAATFALLLGFRLSAKLNIFLGVPAFADELLPPHLAYLRSYFGRPAVNALIPLSLIAGTALTAWLAERALAADGGAAVGASLLFGLAALGLLEHLFLILPVRDAALWRWARSGEKTRGSLSNGL